VNLPEIIETKDGSHSLYVPELDETYHSRNGAITESLHVFIQNGLWYLTDQGFTEISIFELGFGTGLNAFLTVIEAVQLNIRVQYTSIDPYPLPEKIVNALNYHQIRNISKSKEIFDQIHRISWNKDFPINKNFNLLKIKSTIQDFSINKNFNLVYYDAFAPNKQPDVWAIENLEKVYGMLNQNGIFVTYSAQGKLKKDLIAVGFTVDAVPGPPGKREIVRAIKI